MFSFHDAYAISLGWIPGNFTNPQHFAIWSGGPLPQNPPVIPNQFEITDGNYSNNGVTDKINVLLNSTSDPTGITITLTETGDTGHFLIQILFSQTVQVCMIFLVLRLLEYPVMV